MRATGLVNCEDFPEELYGLARKLVFRGLLFVRDVPRASRIHALTRPRNSFSDIFFFQGQVQHDVALRQFHG